MSGLLEVNLESLQTTYPEESAHMVQSERERVNQKATLR